MALLKVWEKVTQIGNRAMDKAGKKLAATLDQMDPEQEAEKILNRGLPTTGNDSLSSAPALSA